MVLLSIFKIFGHSMEPHFKMNQTVIVSGIPYFFNNPKVGDVIVFSYQGKRIIKRIQKIDDRQLLVVGDNKKDSKDFSWIKKSQIIGRVIGSI